MNELMFNSLKQKDYVIKRAILRSCIELNLSLAETCLIIYFYNQDKPLLDISDIKKQFALSEDSIMEAFTRLINIKVINMTIIKNDDGTREEVINIDNLLKNVSMEITENHKNNEKGNLFSLFESEFGRPLSPMEFELLDSWIRKGFSEEIIEEALKEAIYNNTRSFKYISKILASWKELGYKTKDDLKKEKKENSNPSSTLLNELDDYNWLDDHE